MNPKVVAIVCRAWFPNHQQLFDRVAARLARENVTLRYGVMLASEKGRRWHAGSGGGGVSVEVIGRGRSFVIGDKEIASPQNVRQWIRSVTPTCVVVTPASEYGNFVAVDEAYRMNVPAIGWLVGTRDFAEGLVDSARRNYSKTLHYEFCRRLDYALAYGTKAANDVLCTGLLPSRRIAIVRHCIEERDYLIDDFDRREELRCKSRLKFGIQRDFTFTYIGQLIRRKGIDVLLAAFERVLERDSSVALMILGRGAMEADVRKTDAFRKGRITLVKDVAQSDMRSLYAASDCVIVPSRFDDWSTVINESICALTPVLASQGAHAAFDLLPEERRFPPNSVEALSALMQQAARQRLVDFTTALRAAQKRYLRLWTMDAAADIWTSQLLQCIRRRDLVAHALG